MSHGSSSDWAGSRPSCRATRAVCPRPAPPAASRAGCGRRFDAELRPGAATVLDALGVDERLRAAQLVVAGEGCLDEQSLGGKVVGEILRRARAGGVPAHAVVGRSRLSAAEAAAAGFARVWIASTLAEIEAAGRALGQAATRA